MIDNLKHFNDQITLHVSPFARILPLYYKEQQSVVFECAIFGTFRQKKGTYIIKGYDYAMQVPVDEQPNDSDVTALAKTVFSVIENSEMRMPCRQVLLRNIPKGQERLSWDYDNKKYNTFEEAQQFLREKLYSYTPEVFYHARARVEPVAVPQEHTNADIKLASKLPEIQTFRSKLTDYVINNKSTKGSTPSYYDFEHAVPSKLPRSC